MEYKRVVFYLLDISIYFIDMHLPKQEIIKILSANPSTRDNHILLQTNYFVQTVYLFISQKLYPLLICIYEALLSSSFLEQGGHNGAQQIPSILVMKMLRSDKQVVRKCCHEIEFM